MRLPEDFYDNFSHTFPRKLFVEDAYGARYTAVVVFDDTNQAFLETNTRKICRVYNLRIGSTIQLSYRSRGRFKFYNPNSFLFSFENDSHSDSESEDSDYLEYISNLGTSTDTESDDDEESDTDQESDSDDENNGEYGENPQLIVPDAANEDERNPVVALGINYNHDEIYVDDDAPLPSEDENKNGDASM